MLEQGKGKGDDSDMVWFVDGRSYAIDSTGKTWDVGSEETVKETLRTGIISPDLCHEGRRQALQIVLDYRREESGYGDKPETKRIGSFRSRPARDIKHRKGTTRRTALPQRTALHPTK